MSEGKRKSLETTKQGEVTKLRLGKGSEVGKLQQKERRTGSSLDAVSQACLLKWELRHLHSL